MAPRFFWQRLFGQVLLCLLGCSIAAAQSYPQKALPGEGFPQASPQTAPQPTPQSAQDAQLDRWIAAGYEVLPVPPIPGPGYILRWVEEVYCTSGAVPVIRQNLETQLVPGYEARQVTTSRPVTRMVPQMRRELVTTYVTSKERRTVEVPVIRHKRQTTRVQEPVLLLQRYRALSCEPLPQNPCISVPTAHDVQVATTGYRERTETQRVPFLKKFKRKKIKEEVTRPVIEEVERVHYVPRTELQPITRTEYVPTLTEVQTQRNTVEYEQYEQVRRVLRPVWCPIDQESAATVGPATPEFESPSKATPPYPTPQGFGSTPF